MKKLLRDRKGSSAILWVVLIIVVTVASGLVYLSYVSGMIDNMRTNVNTQLNLLLIEVVNINTTCITAYLRNTGCACCNIVTAYVNSIPAVLSQMVSLSPTNMEPINIYGNYFSGTTYQVKLISTLGMLVTFDARL